MADRDPSPVELAAYKRAESTTLLREFENRADTLCDWIQKRWPTRNFLAARNFHLPPAGGSSETLFFDIAWRDEQEEHDERLVLRREPADGNIFPLQSREVGSNAGLQYYVQHAVGRHSQIPIPPLVGYEADPAVLDRPFFVMGFVPGKIPAESATDLTVPGWFADELSPAQRREITIAAVQKMAELHAIDWRQAGLGWLDASRTGNPTLGVQLQIYRDATRRLLAGREHPVLYSTLDWLEEHDPHDERVGISWGDARLGNIIFQDLHPAALIDWEGCSLIPTEADIGWWNFVDWYGAQESGGRHLEGYPSQEQLVALYERLSGRAIRHLDYWTTYAAMRLAHAWIRVVDRRADSGAVPADMAIDNFATRYLVQRGVAEDPGA